LEVLIREVSWPTKVQSSPKGGFMANEGPKFPVATHRKEGLTCHVNQGGFMPTKAKFPAASNPPQREVLHIEK
jgi:hypothetical protein